MFEEKVELKKKRDFSDVLNASFAFIKQEYKTLWKVLFLYAGVPVLISAVLGTLFVDSALGDYFKMIANPSMSSGVETSFPGQSLLYNLISLIVDIFLSGLTYCYVVLYVQQGPGNFTSAEVWHKFSGFFGSLLGFSIVNGLVYMLSLIALIIPFFYVMVPVSFILMIKVAEDNGYSKTFERCFFLVKNHWWESLGLLFIAGIIVFMISLLFSLPASSYSIAKGLLNEQFSIDSIPFVITTFISTIGAAIIQPLPAIVIGFQYYSLVEHKENTSLLDKINKINTEQED
jgi:hypothetical protein